MRIHFDQKPSKMTNIGRLKKAVASSRLSDIFKKQSEYLGSEFLKMHTSA
jgi:hypothetical protein